MNFNENQSINIPKSVSRNFLRRKETEREGGNSSPIDKILSALLSVMPLTVIKDFLVVYATASTVA